MKFSFFKGACFCVLLQALQAGAAQVVINEIMYHPAPAMPEDKRREWIELHNPGTNAVDLSGWRFADGVDFTFPLNTLLQPGAYLVVAANRVAFQTEFPGVANVLGDWIGQLSNTGEDIELVDAQGEAVTSVRYADSGDWAVRQRLLVGGQPSWDWLALHDGQGPSLELINADLPNTAAQNWAPSQLTGGTPGAPNSTRNANIAPLILEPNHLPAIPRSTDSVTIAARLVDEQLTGVTGMIFYRDATSTTPPALASTNMFDDGAHGDGLPGDGVFGAVLPALASGTVVEFYIQAADAGARTRTWPAPALDGVFGQLANAHYQVDDENYTGTQPILRLILTGAERQLRANLDSFNTGSDAQQNLTLISIDGTSTQIRHNADIRIRGAGSRGRPTKNYRVNIPSDRPWNNLTAINLNSQYPHAQLVGSVVAQKAGLPAANARLAQVRVNGQNLARSGAPIGGDGASWGSYVLVEPINNEWAGRIFPQDGDGNVYRASSGGHLADLSYQGTNPNSYISRGYSKTSNQSENDWEDLIELTDTLNNAPDSVYTDSVTTRLNVREWMTYFAVFTLMEYSETALGQGEGDDYSLYRGLLDQRFRLVGHDFDTIFGQGDTGGNVNESIWLAADTDQPAVDRFLKWPEFAPIYYETLFQLANGAFTDEQINPIFDQHLGTLVTEPILVAMKNFNAGRRLGVLNQIPQAIRVLTAPPTANGYPMTTAASVNLAGLANAIHTRSVRVNDVLATWTAWQGRWSVQNVPLNPGINRLLIQSFNAQGVESERATFDVWYDDGSVVDIASDIISDTTWTAAGGPYRVSGVVEVAATLTIQPGTTVYFGTGGGMLVNGRLLWEGTDLQRIIFTREPGTVARWDGIDINSGAAETRIAYAHFEFNNSTAIHATDAIMFLDHLTFGSADRQYISLDRSSFVVQDCVFPTSTGSFEPVHGSGGIKAGGRGIFRRNFWGKAQGYNDSLDFTGGNRPGPILQILNNVFLGSDDDLLDLDSTDAWVEGNIFLHTHRNNSPDSASGISGGADNADTSQITIIGNLFYDVDHAVNAKQGNFYTMLGNTIVRQTRQGGVDTDAGVVTLADEGSAEGAGLYLEGNIISDAEKLLRLGNPALVTFTNNLMSLPWGGPGGGNETNLPPSFKHIPGISETTNFTSWAAAQVLWDWLGLLPGSAIPQSAFRNPRSAGASISGEPNGVTFQTSATLMVGPHRTGHGIPTTGFPNGSGFTHYRWRLDGGAWSAETPIATPITLNGLANGAHYVEVSGRNDAGFYQDDPVFGPDAVVTRSRTWTVNASFGAVRLNEILAANQAVFPHVGTFPDAIEIYNASAATVDLSGWGVTDEATNRFKFKFPADTLLAAGQYLVLLADNRTDLAGLHLGFGLDQAGDGVFLYNNAGDVADSVQFGFQLSDLSIGRANNSQWTLCRPTFGAENITHPLGDPFALSINEWLANAGTLYQNDFVEIYNSTPLPVLLGGLYLTDEPLGWPNQHRVPALSFMDGAAHFVFIADGDPQDGADHLNFKLSAEQGAIGLFDANVRLIDCVFYGSQSVDLSEGRRPSGGSAIGKFTVPTPGAPNPGTGGSTIIITSIVESIFGVINKQWRYDAGAIDRGTGWRAAGYDDSSWATGFGLFGSETPGTYPFPIQTPIPPPSQGGPHTAYFRTHFDWTNGTGWSLVATSYVDDGAVFYVNGFEAGRVRITANPVFYNSAAQNANDGNVDIITLASTNLVTGDNVLAVEVHQSAGGNSTDDIFGLALSAVKFSTNEIVFGLTLNEVLARNLSFTNDSSGGTNAADWFEVFNPSTNSFVLAGLSVSDQLDNPRRWVFPAGLSLAPGGYLVVRCDPDAPASTNLGGQSMVLNTGFGLNSDEGDAVYLFDSLARGGALLDSVVFGLQAPDFSVARSPNASGLWALALPTPGAANIAASLGNAANLKVNEWLASPAGNDDDFLELYNPNPQPVALGGLYLSDSLTNRTTHRIQDLSFIGAGEDGFALFFADGNTENGADHVSFNLRAAGESVALFSAAQVLIDAYTFGAQENGVSEGRFPDGSTNIVRFRAASGGSQTTATPGRSNLLPIENVAINEVLTHSDPPFEDAIELRNISAAAVDISGWYLSDRRTDPKRFRIPNGTVLAPSGLVVFYEGQFNPDLSGRPPFFALSSTEGEELFLHTADAAGTLTGFRTSENFGAAENGVSFGRHATSVGFDFTAMSQRTFGADNPATIEQFRTGTGLSNAYPRVGPVVISEIMYHPPDIISGGATNDNELDEFIELHNITGTNVPLYHTAFPTNTWRLRDAVDFDFPMNVTLAAGGRLLVVDFDPATNAAALAAFRAKFSVNPSIPIHGPWQGRLANDTENVELYKPDAPQAPGLPDAGFVPYVEVDKVKYADTSPWPVLADGNTNGVGMSLQRRVASDYGNDPVNWIAGAPTPGAATGPAALTPPSITSITPPHDVVPGANDSLTVVATGGGTLTYQWRFDGTVIPGATAATFFLNNFQPARAGVYSVVVANGAGAAWASTRVDLRSLPIIVRQPQDQIAATNTTAVFTVAAGGTQPLSYQWQKGNLNIPAGGSATGVNSPALVIPNVQVADVGSYRVIITNLYGAATSSVATLSIVSPPVITAQPQSTNAFVSQSVTFNVGVFGSPPLRFQWRFNGANIPGATNPSLTLSNLQLTNSGAYSVRITNNISSVISDSATLLVTVAPIVRIVATDAAASEPGGNGGLFTITRSGSVGFAQTVHFTVSGNALPGSDYVALGSPVSIPVGSAELTLPVNVLNDATREGNESVTVTLSEGFDYVAGPPASATVVITDDDNLAPTVTLTSPSDGLLVTFPATITLAANAADSDGSVMKVAFFDNGTNKLGEDALPPYSFSWSNAVVGSHVLTAVVTDDLGSTGVSTPVTVVVNGAPGVAITSPANGAVLEAGSSVSLSALASDPDGSVTLVEFFEGANLIGSATTPNSGSARADYRFENSLASSIAGAPILANLGNNVFASATVDGMSRTVLSFAQNDGVQLTSASSVMPGGIYSVSMLFSLGNVSSYRRLLDFSNGTSDTGLYLFEGGLMFYPATNPSGVPITPNSYVQVVLTRDSARNVVGYVNGSQRFAFADTNNFALLNAANVLRFFRDDGTEASAGSVARIRIYDFALSASEVAALDRLPGGGPVGASYSVVWTNLAVGDYVLTAQATDNRGAIAVSAPIGVTVSVPIPRFVDNFASRGTLTGFTNFITGTNSTYTREPGEPRHDNRSGTHSGWLSWTAPISGVCTMDTFGSSFDTVLAVYTGSVLSNLVRIASNDDGTPEVTQSRVTFNATSGVTYQIAVDGFSATAFGTIMFHLNIPNPNPVITTQPQDITVARDSNAVFTVRATGGGPLTYQWRYNGVPMAGTTSSNLVLLNVQGRMEGVYSVTVSTALGVTTSRNALLTVNDGLVVNTSARLLDITNAWRYEASGLDLGSAWRSPAYNDSGWSNGVAMFGLEDPGIYPLPILTPLSLRTSGNVFIVTFYFRTTFSLPPPSTVNSLLVEAYVDDGAVWYLNGREAGRLRIPGNVPIGGVTNGVLAQSPNNEGVLSTLSLPLTNAVAGENLLAVEVHQSSIGSTDVVFGMTLSSFTRQTNGPVLLTPNFLPGGVEVTLAGISGRNYAIDVSTNLANWSHLRTWTNFTGSAVYLDAAAGINGNRFYRGRLVP